MGTLSILISESFYNDAKLIADTQKWTVDQQIEHWGKIGKIMEQNPDLPYNVIKDTLIGLNEAKHGQLEDYVFGEGEE